MKSDMNHKDEKVCEPCVNCNCSRPNKWQRRGYGNAGGGGAVYGLGLIGAVIFFVGQATSFWVGVLGILKAIVWPAILVYELFKHFL